MATPRKKLPQSVRQSVWDKHCPNKRDRFMECACGCGRDIDILTFECGHVLAHARGGGDTIDNLRPICRECNRSMGDRHMDEFIAEFYGKKFVATTLISTTDRVTGSRNETFVIGKDAGEHTKGYDAVFEYIRRRVVYIRDAKVFMVKKVEEGAVSFETCDLVERVDIGTVVFDHKVGSSTFTLNVPIYNFIRTEDVSCDACLHDPFTRKSVVSKDGKSYFNTFCGPRQAQKTYDEEVVKRVMGYVKVATSGSDALLKWLSTVIQPVLTAPLVVVGPPDKRFWKFIADDVAAPDVLSVVEVNSPNDFARGVRSNVIPGVNPSNVKKNIAILTSDARNLPDAGYQKVDFAPPAGVQPEFLPEHGPHVTRYLREIYEDELVAGLLDDDMGGDDARTNAGTKAEGTETKTAKEEKKKYVNKTPDKEKVQAVRRFLTGVAQKKDPAFVVGVRLECHSDKLHEAFVRTTKSDMSDPIFRRCLKLILGQQAIVHIRGDRKKGYNLSLTEVNRLVNKKVG